MKTLGKGLPLVALLLLARGDCRGDVVTIVFEYYFDETDRLFFQGDTFFIRHLETHETDPFRAPTVHTYHPWPVFLDYTHNGNYEEVYEWPDWWQEPDGTWRSSEILLPSPGIPAEESWAAVTYQLDYADPVAVATIQEMPTAANDYSVVVTFAESDLPQGRPGCTTVEYRGLLEIRSGEDLSIFWDEQGDGNWSDVDSETDDTRSHRPDGEKGTAERRFQGTDRLARRPRYTL